MKDGLENIDEVFKQAFDGFEANVDPSVWTNIQSGLSAGATSGTPQVNPVSTAVKSSVMKSAIVKIAATVVAVGTIATASYYVATSGEEEEKVVAESVIKETPASEKTFVENEKEETVSVTDENVKTTVDTENEAVKRVVPTVENEKIASETTESNVSDNTTSETENNNTITETSNNQSAVSESENETPDLNASNQAPTKIVDKPKEKQPKVNEQPLPKEEKPAKKEAVVNPILKAFSPNGDGRNDVIKITGENLDKMELVIMDKTGKIVYKMTNIEQAWDGKDMNGFDLIQGTYYIAGVVVDTDGNTKQIKQAINLFK